MSVPTLSTVSGFGATLKLTVLGPEPLAPDVIVIQAAWLEALEKQVEPVLIDTVPVPPAAESDRLVESIAKVQLVPYCETVKT